MVRFAKKNQLTDEQFRQVLDETEQQFRQEIKGWRLHRFDGNSPLLSQLPNLMDAMAQGVRELMEGYKYAEENRDRLDNLKGMPPTKPKMTGALGWMMRNRNDPSELRHTITRTVPAIALLTMALVLGSYAQAGSFNFDAQALQIRTIWI
ncbi:MAG: hypothetical protein EBV03_01040 [Proteobacteria bacterium]|nr:hypothetical protein [Pseudomonadota bacterium]